VAATEAATFPWARRGLPRLADVVEAPDEALRALFADLELKAFRNVVMWLQLLSRSSSVAHLVGLGHRTTAGKRVAALPPVALIADAGEGALRCRAALRLPPLLPQLCVAAWWTN
jgi:hypothetical protein